MLTVGSVSTQDYFLGNLPICQYYLYMGILISEMILYINYEEKYVITGNTSTARRPGSQLAIRISSDIGKNAL